MQLNQNHKKSLCNALLPVFLFVCLFCLSMLYPLTGDDWYREELGQRIGSLCDLYREIRDRYLTTNPRIMGNLLAYTAGSRPILREILRAGFTLFLMLTVHRACRFRSAGTLLLTCAACIALPSAMFAQIYPWAAGFFNFLPPVALSLVCFGLMDNVFTDQPVRDSLPKASTVFILGFLAQFFVENITVYAVLAAVFLVICHRCKHKKFSWLTLAYLAGTALGALLLFSSPAYAAAFRNEGAYRVANSGLAGHLATMWNNHPTVFKNLVYGCPVLYCGLTLLCALAFWRSRRRSAADWTVFAALLLCFADLLVNQITGFAGQPPVVSAGVSVLWGLGVIAGQWRWTGDPVTRNRAVFFTVSAAAAAIPLLLVSPIGPRCLYISYIFLLISAGNMLCGQGLEKIRKPYILGAGAAVFALVFAFYFYLFIPIHQVEMQRLSTLETAIANGETSVTLPRLPNSKYLWSPELTMDVYYKDIEIFFTPET